MRPPLFAALLGSLLAATGAFAQTTDDPTTSPASESSASEVDAGRRRPRPRRAEAPASAPPSTEAAPPTPRSPEPSTQSPSAPAAAPAPASPTPASPMTPTTTAAAPTPPTTTPGAEATPTATPSAEPTPSPTPAASAAPEEPPALLARPPIEAPTNEPTTAASPAPAAEDDRPRTATDTAEPARDTAGERDAERDAQDTEQSHTSDRDVARGATPAPIVVQTERDDEPRFDLTAEVEAIFESLTGERTTLGLFTLVFSLALAILLALALRRVRESLPERGVIPTLLAFLHLTLRLLAVTVVLLLVLRVLPPRLSVVALFTLVAVAVALGWSVRDFLPDLVAGFVVVFERRVRRGTWISAPGFAGQVERLGFRSTLLRDAQGRRVDVPNRHLLAAPVTSGGHHEREHEVEVQLDATLPASIVRAALRDAVLASPWVFPGADAVVLRDPDEPRRWRVRGRLLEAGFGARFEGELLERVEALLPAIAPGVGMTGLVVPPAPETPNNRADPIDPPSRTRRAPPPTPHDPHDRSGGPPDDPEVV